MHILHFLQGTQLDSISKAQALFGGARHWAPGQALPPAPAGEKSPRERSSISFFPHPQAERRGAQEPSGGQRHRTEGD